MAWNYRLMAHETTNGVYFHIHTVYYDKNNNPNGYSTKPFELGSDTVKGMNWTLNKMKLCIKKPILWAGRRFPDEYTPNH